MVFAFSHHWAMMAGFVFFCSRSALSLHLPFGFAAGDSIGGVDDGRDDVCDLVRESNFCRTGLGEGSVVGVFFDGNVGGDLGGDDGEKNRRVNEPGRGAVEFDRILRVWNRRAQCCGG